MGSSISSKKRTNEFVLLLWRLVIVRFLEEIDDPRKRFEINWPLVARGVGESAVDWALFLWNASVVSTLCGQKIFRALMLRAHNQMKAGKKKDVTKGSFNNYVDRIFDPPPCCVVELYRTSRPVGSLANFQSPDCLENRNFPSRTPDFRKFYRFFFVCLFTFDPKFVSRDLILWELITCTW